MLYLPCYEILLLNVLARLFTHVYVLNGFWSTYKSEKNVFSLTLYSNLTSATTSKRYKII